MYPSPLMAELVFRAFKNQPLTNGNDTVAMKQYFNNHQDEVKKEVESLKKMPEQMRQQSLNRLTK